MQNFFSHHHIKAQKIAVAVSGGADSLALVLMAKEQLPLYGYEIVALTVDHGLRPNSATEAAYVTDVMKAHNIEHHILKWSGKKPQTGIEETARKARYKLLTEWCLQNNVRVLLTAHHQNDQAETFLIRLERGSGLEGLCSIREISNNNGIIIARPLLHTSPETMRQYLLDRNIKWVEDESNDDTTYLRNRIRTFMPLLHSQTGITVKCLADTATRLQSAEEFIEQQVNQIFNEQINRLSNDVVYFKQTDFLHWHREIKFRILAQLCRRNYIPRAEHILNAVAAISQIPFTGLTLGGKEIFQAYNNIWVVPELSAKHKTSRTAWKEFLLKNQQYKNVKIPHKARLALLQKKDILK